MRSRRTSFWLQLVLVLSLLVPSVAIWSQPSAPETSAALVKPQKEKGKRDDTDEEVRQYRKQAKKNGILNCKQPITDQYIKDQLANPDDKPRCPGKSKDERQAKKDHKYDSDINLPRLSKKERRAARDDDTLGVNQLLDEPVTDVTPVAEATPVPKPTKKERKAARAEAAGLVSIAAFAEPAPARDARMTYYYGAADNHNDALFPWQFVNGFDKIEDAQRPVNGKNSHWVVTDCAAFCGWDIFPFGRVTGGHAKEGGNQWARFLVTRTTMVGYNWRDPNPAPSWLAANGWVDSGIITSRNPEKGWTSEPQEGHVYTKEFPAGMVDIPGPSNGTAVRILPWLLFADAGGARPTMPSGYHPNEYCGPVNAEHPAPPANPANEIPGVVYARYPQVHDAIKAPNSNWPTWHLPFDPKSHCYFGHSHLSNPALVYGNAGFLRFGEIAAAGGMNAENHWGNKVYTLDFVDVDAILLQHQGTTGLGRANTCQQQFHNFELHVLNNSHNTTLAVYRFMADYGRSVGLLIGDEKTGNIDPPACPNGNAQLEAQGYTQTVPARQIPVPPFCLNSTAYEPWSFNEDRYVTVLGLYGNPVVNTTDPMTCPGDNDATFAIEMLTRSGTGSFFTPNNLEVRCPSHANAQGFWWTNAMATQVVTSTTPGAVRQFCKPGWGGFAVGGPGSAEAAHRGGEDASTWGGWSVAVPSGEPGDFERSTTDLHGPN